MPKDYHPITKGDPKSPPTPSSHPDLWAFLIAGLPQLIPGGGIIGDYLKSFPTTYFYKKKRTGWSGDAGNAAMINALWIGGQAVTVDILLSGFAELANIQPYLRAFVCGTANQYYNTGVSWKEDHFKSWAMNLAFENPQKLESLYSLWSFLLGFLAMKNNVGGGAASSAAFAGLATGSSMILNPNVFEIPSYNGDAYFYDVKSYLMVIATFVFTEALIAKFLEGRVSAFWLNTIIGIINASLRSRELGQRVFGYLRGEQPIVPPGTGMSISRGAVPQAYAYY